MVIETNLSPRYEIRVLEPRHSEWANAIVAHSNIFYSPVWPILYPEKKTRRAYACYKAFHCVVEHQINSGYSLGVFDKEYEYKRPESAATGGALYWDLADESADAATLLRQMDFPLVSVALAYDSFDPVAPEKVAPFLEVFPAMVATFQVLGSRDKRDPTTWKPQGPGEVLGRFATSTRRDYEGRGLMREMAQYMMRRSATQGFRGIQIGTFSDRVYKVWANPPVPFKGQVVSEFQTITYEEEGADGVKTYPMRPVDERAATIYITLQ